MGVSDTTEEDWERHYEEYLNQQVEDHISEQIKERGMSYYINSIKVEGWLETSDDLEKFLDAFIDKGLILKDYSLCNESYGKKIEAIFYYDERTKKWLENHDEQIRNDALKELYDYLFNKTYDEDLKCEQIMYTIHKYITNRKFIQEVNIE